MNPRIVFVFIVLALVVAGGTFLGTRDIPAPRHPIEKTISNDHFAK